MAVTVAMNPQEIEHVQKSWKNVMGVTDFETHGNNFFIMLCIKEPVIKARFTDIADIPMEKLIAEKTLLPYGTTVLAKITSWVDELLVVEQLEKNLDAFTKSHKIKKISVPKFKLLLAALREYCHELLKEAWTPEVEKAWIQFDNAITGLIGSFYEKIGAKELLS